MKYQNLMCFTVIKCGTKNKQIDWHVAVVSSVPWWNFLMWEICCIFRFQVCKCGCWSWGHRQRSRSCSSCEYISQIYIYDGKSYCWSFHRRLKRGMFTPSQFFFIFISFLILVFCYSFLFTLLYFTLCKHFRYSFLILLTYFDSICFTCILH